MEKQGEKQENGSFAYDVDGEILPAKKATYVAEEAQIFNDSWVYADAKKENALSKPYTPSKLDDGDDADSISPLSDDGNYYKRGTIIHKLLQFLPQIDGDKAEKIRQYLEQTDFSTYEKNEIEKEVSAVLNNPEFADILGENSRAEVPVMGEVNGKIISAQLDRLIILPDKIKIVDFKTNRRIDEIPPAYINQLNVYAELMKKIYPDLPVETYILWTNKLKLSRIS